jgi:hypothetical protein
VSKEKERNIAAYHEAGHAVIAQVLGHIVLHVSIHAQGGGVTKFDPALKRDEPAILAGPYTQKHFAPFSGWRSRNRIGWQSGYDLDNIDEAIADMHDTDKVRKAYLRYLEARAEALVDENWDWIDAVARMGDLRMLDLPLNIPSMTNSDDASRRS